MKKMIFLVMLLLSSFANAKRVYDHITDGYSYDTTSDSLHYVIAASYHDSETPTKNSIYIVNRGSIKLNDGINGVNKLYTLSHYTLVVGKGGYEWIDLSTLETRVYLKPNYDFIAGHIFMWGENYVIEAIANTSNGIKSLVSYGGGNYPREYLITNNSLDSAVTFGVKCQHYEHSTHKLCKNRFFLITKDNKIYSAVDLYGYQNWKFIGQEKRNYDHIRFVTSTILMDNIYVTYFDHDTGKTYFTQLLDSGNFSPDKKELPSNQNDFFVYSPLTKGVFFYDVRGVISWINLSLDSDKTKELMKVEGYNFLEVSTFAYDFNYDNEIMLPFVSYLLKKRDTDDVNYKVLAFKFDNRLNRGVATHKYIDLPAGD